MLAKHKCFLRVDNVINLLPLLVSSQATGVIGADTNDGNR
jgi:hypothetical protein